MRSLTFVADRCPKISVIIVIMYMNISDAILLLPRFYIILLFVVVTL